MVEFLVMYHGAIAPGRCIESVIDLVKINYRIVAVILGNGSIEYEKKLRNYADQENVSDRIIYHKAVANSELWKYVGAVDVGLILATAASANMLYSLPNKFFENIQSETPVICPFYPAMKDLVDRYGIGLTCNPEDINSINDCVEKLRTDNQFYRLCKQNVYEAKKELCWEKEKSGLAIAYKQYTGLGGRFYGQTI